MCFVSIPSLPMPMYDEKKKKKNEKHIVGNLITNIILNLSIQKYTIRKHIEIMSFDSKCFSANNEAFAKCGTNREVDSHARTHTSTALCLFVMRKEEKKTFYLNMKRKKMKKKKRKKIGCACMSVCIFLA